PFQRGCCRSSAARLDHRSRAAGSWARWPAHRRQVGLRSVRCKQKEVTLKTTIRLEWAALPLILAAVWTVHQGVLQLTAPTPALARNNRPAAGKTTAAAVAAANAFLTTLPDSQRAAVKFAFTD